MLFPSDGAAGIMKFVLDSVRDGCFAGKICPPAIVGVGIGGTADLCVKMAKEAAVLRHVGSAHPDPKIDAMERRLVAAIHDLGIGPMGLEGKKRRHGGSYRHGANAYRRAAGSGKRPVPGRDGDGTATNWRETIR